MHNDNWDDLRYVLAVVDTGSVSAAARDLGVNHATVLRRITAFEQTHGAEVFERLQQGYRLRPDRAHVIEAAREAAQALGRVSHLLRANGDGTVDLLRLTSTDTLCTTVLARAAAPISAAIAPHRLCLVSSNTHLDMSRLQADLTLRPAEKKPADMDGVQVGTLVFDTYARDRDAQAWLGLAGPLARSVAARWLAENVAAADIVASADSFVSLREMARAGAGVAILPMVLGEEQADLHPVERGLGRLSVPIWLLCHPDLGSSARTQKFLRAVADALRENPQINAPLALATATVRQ